MADSALDAMNEALAAVPGTGVAPKEPEDETLPPVDAENETDETVDSSGEGADESTDGEDTGAGKKDGDEGKLADETADKDDKDGKNADSTTKTVKKDGEEPKLDADGKPVAKEAKPKEPPKPLDPLNDPIPVGAAERTRERITSLIGMVKERDAVVAQHNEMLGLISGTGATPDEFGNMVSYMRLVHSTNIDDKRAALKIAQSELRALALELGEPVEGYDALAEHADLVERVEAGTLTREDAQEIAVARTRRTTAAATNATAVQAQAAAAERQEAVNAGIAELNAYGAQMAASDPLYGQKYLILVGGKNADGTKFPGTLTPVINQIHPSKWKSTFEAAYKNLRVTAPAAPVTVTGTPPVVKGQPLRPKTPSGDGKKAPTSALEAMNAALEGR